MQQYRLACDQLKKIRWIDVLVGAGLDDLFNVIKDCLGEEEYTTRDELTDKGFGFFDVMHNLACLLIRHQTTVAMGIITMDLSTYIVKRWFNFQ